MTKQFILTKDDLIPEKGWTLSMGARPINSLLIEATDAEKIDVALRICSLGSKSELRDFQVYS